MALGFKSEDNFEKKDKMKTKVFVLTWLMVFSSCYSYKSIGRDLSSFEQGERVKLIMNDKKNKGKFITYYSDTIMIKNTNRKTEWYLLSEVKEIKTGKFSWVKTILIPPAALYAIAFGATIFFGEPSYDIELNLN